MDVPGLLARALLGAVLPNMTVTASYLAALASTLFMVRPAKSMHVRRSVVPQRSTPTGHTARSMTAEAGSAATKNGSRQVSHIAGCTNAQEHP